MTASPEDEEATARRLCAALPSVSRETLGALGVLVEEVRRWSPAINLVSKRELDRLWSRHVLDSLGLLELLPERGLWLDLGSGGGFPILPLAIVSRETAPSLRFEAVESDQRKAVFLREAARKLDLPLTVTASRIEARRGPDPAIISARALASVARLLDLSLNWLEKGAPLALLKGDAAFVELTEASREWHIRYQAKRHPLTRKGYILIIQEGRRGAFL